MHEMQNLRQYILHEMQDFRVREDFSNKHNKQLSSASRGF